MDLVSQYLPRVGCESAPAWHTDVHVILASVLTCYDLQHLAFQLALAQCLASGDNASWQGIQQPTNVTSLIINTGLGGHQHADLRTQQLQYHKSCCNHSACPCKAVHGSFCSQSHAPWGGHSLYKKGCRRGAFVDWCLTGQNFRHPTSYVHAVH